jgi:hypothetical protein
VPLYGFTRSLTDEKLRIVAVCDKCGFTIVASVSEGLQDREREHCDGCKGTPDKKPLKKKTK